MVDNLVLPEVVVDGRLPLQGPDEVGVGPVEVLGLHGEEGGTVSSAPLHYVIVVTPPPLVGEESGRKVMAACDLTAITHLRAKPHQSVTDMGNYPWTLCKF